MKIYRITGFRNPLDLASTDLAKQIFKYVKEMFLKGKIKIGFGGRYP
jgi:hypothetical protein